VPAALWKQPVAHLPPRARPVTQGAVENGCALVIPAPPLAELRYEYAMLTELQSKQINDLVHGTGRGRARRAPHHDLGQSSFAVGRV
jgi:hypothetical protein